MNKRRVHSPSRTDIAVLLLIVMAGLLGFAGWAAWNGDWWTAGANLLGVAAIKFFPYGLK